VPASNLHITIIFCGRLPAERIEDVVERTRRGIAVRRAPLYTPSRVRVLARSAVVLGLDSTQPERGRPFGALAAELAHAGLMRRETREWTPHVTIARAGRGRRANPRVEPPGVSFAPDAIAVLESVSVPGGVRYEQRARFPLQSE
jgi:2'-5' RNA ligase